MTLFSSTKFAKAPQFPDVFDAAMVDGFFHPPLRPALFARRGQVFEDQ
jgi:hypothetical protein